MGYQDIIKQHEEETQQILAKREEKDQKTFMGIEDKLRELVTDQGLLDFIKARNIAAKLIEYIEEQKSGVNAMGLFLQPDGSLVISYRLASTNQYGEATYNLTFATPEFVANRRECGASSRYDRFPIDKYEQYIKDEQAFLCSSDTSRNFAPNNSILAEKYQTLLFFGQTAETIEAKLEESLKEIVGITGKQS